MVAVPSSTERSTGEKPSTLDGYYLTGVPQSAIPELRTFVDSLWPTDFGCIMPLNDVVDRLLQTYTLEPTLPSSTAFVLAFAAAVQRDAPGAAADSHNIVINGKEVVGPGNVFRRFTYGLASGEFVISQRLFLPAEPDFKLEIATFMTSFGGQQHSIVFQRKLPLIGNPDIACGAFPYEIVDDGTGLIVTATPIWVETRMLQSSYDQW